MEVEERSRIKIEAIVFAKAEAIENIIEKETQRIGNEKKSDYVGINTKTKIGQRAINWKSKYT